PKKPVLVVQAAGGDGTVGQTVASRFLMSSTLPNALGNPLAIAARINVRRGSDADVPMVFVSNDTRLPPVFWIESATVRKSTRLKNRPAPKRITPLPFLKGSHAIPKRGPKLLLSETAVSRSYLSP